MDDEGDHEGDHEGGHDLADDDQRAATRRAADPSRRMPSLSLVSLSPFLLTLPLARTRLAPTSRLRSRLARPCRLRSRLARASRSRPRRRAADAVRVRGAAAAGRVRHGAPPRLRQRPPGSPPPPSPPLPLWHINLHGFREATGVCSPVWHKCLQACVAQVFAALSLLHWDTYPGTLPARPSPPQAAPSAPRCLPRAASASRPPCSPCAPLIHPSTSAYTHARSHARTHTQHEKRVARARAAVRSVRGPARCRGGRPDGALRGSGVGCQGASCGRSGGGCWG